MRQVLLALVSAMALAACGQTASAPAVEPATTQSRAFVAEDIRDGCNVTVNAPWRPLSGVEFMTTATTAGATCADATATIRIAYGDDQELYVEDYPAAQVMVLAGVQDGQAMAQALHEWLGQERNAMARTSKLPDWPAGASAPDGGEFPFYVEEGVTRDQYVAWRSADVPMFCYVQGMESLACLGVRDSAFTKIGVQSFPG